MLFPLFALMAFMPNTLKEAIMANNIEFKAFIKGIKDIQPEARSYARVYDFNTQTQTYVDEKGLQEIISLCDAQGLRISQDLKSNTTLLGGSWLIQKA